MRPRIFIASATATKDIALALHQALEPECLATVWDQGVFGLSRYPLPSLLQRSRDTDFAAMVIGKDQIVLKDGVQTFAPNANVILEIGLFIGVLGIPRVYLVVPSPRQGKVELPSDLAGITVANYDAEREDGNLDAAMASAARKIRHEIKAQIPFLTREREQTTKVDFFEAFASDFELQIPQSSSLEVCYIHSRRWREIYQDTLFRRLQSGEIKTIKLWLPDVHDSDFMKYLTRRFSDGPAIPGMVYDALSWVLKLKPHRQSKVEVRLYRRMPAYSFYKFDDAAIIALYQMATVKKPVPTLITKPGQAAWEFLERDMKDFRTECRSISRKALRDICQSYEAVGHF